MGQHLVKDFVRNDDTYKIIILGITGSGKSVLYDQIVKYFTGVDKIMLKLIYDYIEDTVNKILENDIKDGLNDKKYLLSLLSKHPKDLDINNVLYVCQKYKYYQLTQRTVPVVTQEIRKQNFETKDKKYTIYDIDDSIGTSQFSPKIIIYTSSLTNNLDESKDYYDKLKAIHKSFFFLVFSKYDVYGKFFTESITDDFEDFKLIGNIYDFSFITKICEKIIEITRN